MRIIAKIAVTTTLSCCALALGLALALLFGSSSQPVAAADRLVPIYQPRTSPVAKPNQYMYGCRLNCPPSVRSLQKNKTKPANRLGVIGKPTCVAGNCARGMDRTRLLPSDKLPDATPPDRLAETRAMPTCAPGFKYNPATLRCQHRADDEGH